MPKPVSLCRQFLSSQPDTQIFTVLYNVQGNLLVGEYIYMLTCSIPFLSITLYLAISSKKNLKLSILKVMTFLKWYLILLYHRHTVLKTNKHTTLLTEPMKILPFLLKS